MAADMNQTTVDDRNAGFWDVLCGSQLAKSIGVTDCSPSSLKRFDDWYFAFYPYLFLHIPFNELAGKDVLEVGLGYGTVSQRIAEAGGRYTGLDIAEGPVVMANHRLRQCGLPGAARQGSILKPPFEPESFDHIVAIGCLHHTGNLAGAIESCRTLLRPGGSLIFMVYYAYSYRRLVQARAETLQYWAAETFGKRGVVGASDDRQRAAYDAGVDGEGAPHTDWISIRSLRHLCRAYSRFRGTLENIDCEPPFAPHLRRDLLLTPWPRRMGLDLYATATK